MKKLILSAVFAAFITVVMLTTGAMAAEMVASGNCGANGDNVTWTLDDEGTLTVSGEGEMEFYGASRTPWHSYKPNIKNIVINNGVTSIGDGTFSGCKSLTSVKIPDSMVSIGGMVFCDCSSLTSIYIPDNVTNIWSGAFYKTGYYENESNWENGVLYIGNHLIEAKKELSGEYKIKDGTVCIAVGAFEGCDGLTRIEIPESISSIGGWAFSYCGSLTSVEIPEGVTSIDEETFSYCSNLINIRIPDSVTSIRDMAFFGCTSLTSVEIPYNVTSVGDGTFCECSSLTYIDIPDSVTSISNQAFCNCNNLTNIKIGNGVMSIGEGVFSGTEYYNNGSNWENDVLYIGNYLIEAKNELYGAYEIKEGTVCIAAGAFSTFFGSKSLTSIEIPDSVTNIGTSAFWGCDSLTSVRMSGNVTTIEGWAFAFCPNLTSIEIPGRVASIGDCAFQGCSSLTSVEIPEGVASIGECAFEYCGSLTSINVDSNNSSYTSVDGVLFSKNKTELICHPKGKPDKIYSILDSVTSIGNYAFSKCTDLTSIYFSGNVTNIGKDAFVGCTGLTDVYYGGSEDDWNKIDIDSYNNPLLNATIHFNSTGPVTELLVGDVNNDGIVNAKDKTIMNRYIAGWEGYAAMILNPDAADVNRDGTINAKDKTILNRYIAGWEGYDSYFN